MRLNNHIILQYSVDGVNKLLQMNPAFRINEDHETGETWVTFEGVTGVQIVKSKDEDCLFCDESKITHEIDKVVLLYRRYSNTDVEFITLYEGECNKERFYTPED